MTVAASRFTVVYRAFALQVPRGGLAALAVLLLVTAWAPPVAAIVNGTVVGEARFSAQYPWAVALVSLDLKGVCTAQLIAPEWVLTAAHCTSMSVTVRVGASDRERAREVKVAEAFRHPRYDSKAGTWDIGLLRLAEPVPGPFVRLITATEAGKLLREGALGVIMGWGKRSPNLTFSVPLVESEVELRQLVREESRFVFEDRASGPCGGDSGGPLLLRRGDGEVVLAGIANRVVGNLCRDGGGISLYADVTAVRPFIEEHLPALRR